MGESKESAICNFRISLCCMLLQVCGKYLRKGKLKSRCDRFLLYFQRFITLHSPIPFDIEWWVKDVLVYVAPNMQRCSDLDEILIRIKELEQTNMSHKDALIVLEEEEEYEQQYEDEEEEEESEDDMADINSYRRKKKITKSDRQFIDEYDKMMEQYRSATTKKTNINNLKHASVLVEDLQKYETSKQAKKVCDVDSNNDDEEDSEQATEFRLLSKKGASSSKLKVGIIKIPKQFVDSMRSKQRKESKSKNAMKSITMSLLDADAEDDEEEETDFSKTTFVDDNNNHHQNRKYKIKTHSVSAKRKYHQNRKQAQHHQLDQEKEVQKGKREEKRKKHQMLGNISQDF